LKLFDDVVERSYYIAATFNHECVTLEHLLAAILEDTEIQDLLSRAKTDVNALIDANYDYLSDPINYSISPVAGAIPAGTSVLRNVIQKAKTQSVFNKRDVTSIDLLLAIYNTADSPAAFWLEKYGPKKADLLDIMSNGTDEETSKEVLDAYCINLNAKASKGKIDPIVGRETEIEKIAQILCRKTKNNVMMIGDPGVGKTAILEGLAKRIVDKNVPEKLQNKVIYSLDIGNLIAGTKFRGDFEERIKQIIAALQKSPNVVLFIDEIHMIMGAGSVGSTGSIDAANMLKPALSRGEFRCIGSTTLEEYRKHIEKDKALVRRFQKIDVVEPSIADAKRILRGIAPYYEKFHGITYDLAALDSAVELTARYIQDKFLPDKAIDIIDSVAAWQNIQPADKRKSHITVELVEQEVSKVAKVPVKTVSADDNEKLAELESSLKKVIFGQDAAIEALVNNMLISRSGLREVEKTIGAFLFSGPSGSGKTEVSKQLAKTLGIDFIRFDMSEYQEKHAVSKLIGSPPGYVGFSDGGSGSGLLVNALEKTPHCVLLIDEIEKAHPDIYSVFLQLMDYGTITNSNGKSVSARNAIVIFTSNLGATVVDKPVIGFNASNRDGEDIKAVKEHFTPEFRNRLDDIIKFNKLSIENMHSILDKYISALNAQTADKAVSVVLDEDAKKWIINKGFDAAMGARPLAKVIHTNIKQPLSREILFGKLKNGGGVIVHVENDKLTFEYVTVTTSLKNEDEAELATV